MVAKIIIKRRFKPDCTMEVLNLLNDLRAAAMSQPGYISGETLIGYEDPRRLTVIGTWQNMESWHHWKESDKRKEFDAMLMLYEVEQTVYEEYLLGTPRH
ncbi:MAG: antibiotic biosynthesis monooxygenase family protein [Thermodesulfobacteriota bacterium]|nr:antibiotic biosynthesis monooxygenase family protein [Thermodesulfobacteriota bacterium]